MPGRSQAMLNICLMWLGVSAFFVEFLDCVLVQDCIRAILGVLCGLKHEFYGEIKYGILGFQIEKETRECVWVLCGE